MLGLTLCCHSLEVLNILLNKGPHIFTLLWDPSNYVAVGLKDKVFGDASSFFLLLLIFDWSIVDLQCCVSFRCTAK